MPDCLGLTSEEAAALLSEQGVPFQTEMTAPPKGGPEGVLRVARQKEGPDGLLLTLCAVPDDHR